MATIRFQMTARRYTCRYALHRLLALLGVGACAGLLLATSPGARAQGLGSIEVQAGSFATASTGERLPFWLGANQRGAVDPTSTNAGLRLGAYRPFEESPGLKYAFGADVLGRASQNGTVAVQELYGRLRYGPAQVTVGRRGRVVGRIDTSLSMGSVTWSQNAPRVVQRLPAGARPRGRGGDQGLLRARLVWRRPVHIRRASARKVPLPSASTPE